MIAYLQQYAQEKFGTADEITELPQEYKDLEKVSLVLSFWASVTLFDMLNYFVISELILLLESIKTFSK